MGVGFSLAVVGRLAGLLGCTVWPDAGFLARILRCAAVDSRLDQRVYHALQACGEQDLPQPRSESIGAGGSDPRPTTFQTLLKISPLSKPPMIPATMATGLYNNVIIAASIHSITAQLARSTPAGNASGRS